MFDLFITMLSLAFVAGGAALAFLLRARRALNRAAVALERSRAALEKLYER